MFFYQVTRSSVVLGTRLKPQDTQGVCSQIPCHIAASVASILAEGGRDHEDSPILLFIYLHSFFLFLK